MPRKPNRTPAYVPKRKPYQAKKDYTRSLLYRLNAWTKTSRQYRDAHPYCESCDYYGYASESRDTDHIIKETSGGAAFDTRNLMALCKDCHNYKTGHERHNPILVSFTYNVDNKKIPECREEALKLFSKRFDKGKGGFNL
jgi:5-methylcytosine-specific restriction endonuclease McrA